MSKVKFIDTSKPMYALKKFSMDNQEYLTGEEVDVSNLNERMLQRLVKYRFVGAETFAVGGGGMKPPKKDPLRATEPTVETVTDEPTVETVETVTDEPTVKLNHVGGGYYEAIGVDGSNVLPEKVQGKDNAKMIAENLGFTVA